MSEVVFDDILKSIKSIGETEKRTIEAATEIARIVNDLTKARINCGLTQRQLAEKSGIKQSAIARMESLQVVPRLDTLIRVSHCLGLTLQFESMGSATTYCEVIDFQSYKTSHDSYNWKTNGSNKVSNVEKEKTYATVG